MAMHLSARYKDANEVQAELVKHFSNSTVARELESFEL